MKTARFTFLELVVVMALMAIISAITAPHLANFYQNTKLSGTARQVAALVNRARDMALIQRRVCQVVWEADHNRLVLKVQKDPVRQPLDFEYAEGRFAQLVMPHGITLTPSAATSGSTPGGTPEATTFTLSNPAGDAIVVQLKAGSGRAVILAN